MAASQPYIDHMLVSLSSTLAFLHSQNIITLQQRNVILDQLPPIPSNNVNPPATSKAYGGSLSRENSVKPWQQPVPELPSIQPLNVSSPTTSSPPIHTPHNQGYVPPTLPQRQNQQQHAMPPPPPPAQSQPQVPTCKAKWEYKGVQADDLSFKKGDVIVLEKEENEHWWRGYVVGQEGRSGLFPSNHVEKLPFTPAPAPPPPINNYNVGPSQYNPYGGGAYPAPSSVKAGYSAPPYGPPGGYQPPQTMAAPQAPPTEPQKESVGSKYGSTLKHSLVGGVGFGAGSAVGSGIINSIF